MITRSIIWQTPNPGQSVVSEFFWSPAEPLCIRFTFTEGETATAWNLSRDLIAAITTRQSHAIGQGDVTYRVLKARTGDFLVITLKSPTGTVMLRTQLDAVAEAINATIAVSPIGDENIWTDKINNELANLLGDAA